MKSVLLPLLVFVLSAFASVSAIAAESGATAHYTYVIVPGATGGGWDWKKVDRLLTADGHTVYRATLTGLGERAHLASPDITLTTHIDDIVNLILFEDLRDVILVGHSYAGMVITGVMDRIPQRIRHVVFLDAIAPNDGENALAVFGQVRPSFKTEGGMMYPPWLIPGSVPPHDVPQSLKTYTEAVSYKNPAAKLLPVTFVRYLAPGQTPESRPDYFLWQRAQARGWTLRTLQSDHDAQRSHPKELAALLEAAPADRNGPSQNPPKF